MWQENLKKGRPAHCDPQKYEEKNTEKQTTPKSVLRVGVSPARGRARVCPYEYTAGYCLGTPPPPGVGGWVGQRPKKSLCTYNRPPIFGPFDKFHFFPEENFSDVGGWVGRPGLARAPDPPPHPGSQVIAWYADECSVCA